MENKTEIMQSETNVPMRSFLVRSKTLRGDFAKTYVVVYKDAVWVRQVILSADDLSPTFRMLRIWLGKKVWRNDMVFRIETLGPIITELVVPGYQQKGRGTLCISTEPK